MTPYILKKDEYVLKVDIADLPKVAILGADGYEASGNKLRGNSAVD